MFQLAIAGRVIRVFCPHSVGAVTSAPIILTVSPDTVPPVVARIYNVGVSQVDVVFSKPVTSATVSDLSNYSFTNGLTINSATLSTDEVTAVLSASPLTYSSNYSLVINGILDRASTPVMIATNTKAAFTASPYVPADIGNPAIASSCHVLFSNGLTVTGWRERDRRTTGPIWFSIRTGHRKF